MAKKNSFQCFKGEAIEITLTMPPGQDISGWTIRFALKHAGTDAVALVDKVCNVTNGPGGVFKLSLTAAETTRDAKVYAYDIWRVDAGFEAALSIGSFTIQQGVRVP